MFMKISRFSESQIVGILKEFEGGIPVADILRTHVISQDTLYK
jgi:putative transposase